MRNRESRSGQPAATADVLGLSGDAFVLLRDLIVQRTGVFFDQEQRDTLADKLAELVAARGLTSFLDYYYLLRYDPGADFHWAELMDRLAVPETYFWRQPEQFAALVEHIVPEHFRNHPNRPLRIWSAACCTGEEPLSIAMALAEAGWLRRAPIEIVASDGSAAMVAKARAGVYRDRAFRALPEALRSRYFAPGEGGWLVDPRLQSAIEWRTANLAEPRAVESLAMADVIFCRNVFIYFSDEAITRTAELFYERMPVPGHLFLGSAESLTRLGSAFELDQLGNAFVYVKRLAGAAPAPPPLTLRAPGARTMHRQEQ